MAPEHANGCRTAVISGIALMTLIAFEPAGAQEDDALSAMDYIEIQQLVNRLNFALDYCGDQGREFADLFVDGGRFIIDQGDGMPIVRSTRQELIALAGGPDCDSHNDYA
jgi:hypothetical protein